MSSDRVALLVEEENEDEEISKICRICLDNCNQQDLISPCLCTGGSEYVHRACLDNWRDMNKNGRAFEYCDVCQFQYVIEPIIDDPIGEKRRRRLFYLFVTRDLTIFMLIIQLIIIGIDFLLQIVDKKNQNLRKFYPPTMSIFFVYYLTSLILFLACLGLFGLIGFCCGLTQQDRNRTYHHNDNCDCCYMVYCTPDTSCNGCDCCQGSNDDNGCAAIFLIAVIVILAAIGIFVGNVLSWMIIDNIFKRHTNRLWLKQETKKYVVKDFQDNRNQLSNIQHERLNAMPSAPIEPILISHQPKCSK